MPLPDNLLSPIPGSNPCGENLRYAPIYDRIKEARRVEDDAPRGDYFREAKKADYPLVIELATGVLAAKSKDLQIAAWLTEALLRRDGFPGLREGLNLLRGLLENFWDTVYPELEDADAELRATPLAWVGSYLEQAVKSVPLARGGFHWFDYIESRAVGYGHGEVAAEGEKKQKPSPRTAEGKLTPEAFDEDVAATSKAFYEQLMQDLDGSLESLQLLDDLCNHKFGEAAPSFRSLRTALEEVKQTVRPLLKKKEEQQPEAQQVLAEASAEEGEPSGAAPAVARAPTSHLAAEDPADREDAVRRIIAVARYLRREEPISPVPYLMLRSLRWGELRAAGPDIDPALLEAPSTETRQQLKRLALEGQWPELLEAVELAMGKPCGRAWLDLQRYVVKACDQMGSSHDSIATAVRSELKALLADFPQLPQLTLTDDTPAANPETQAWLHEQVNPPEPARQATILSPIVEDEEPQVSETAQPSAHDLAMQAVRSGRAEEAIEILAREAAQERSGRARFQRRIELAGICMASGHEAIAYPILEELANEIERRKLDEWEAPDAVAHPLTLLFHCLQKMDRNSEEKQRVYARICRLDPVQALECSK